MDSSRVENSDGNGSTYGADFLKLARELEISEYVLEIALDDAARLMRQSPPSVRPANKRALRSVARPLERTIERLSKPGVPERLTAAVYEEPEEADADDHAAYFAWVNAQHRVDRAIEGARDLLKFINRGEDINLRSGRPAYDHYGAAILSLLGFWIEDLQRDVTISGHAADSRKVRPSPTLRFIHGSMRLIGQEMPEQTCRRILQKFQEEFGDSETKPWS
jgi:hypothetical protein